MAGPSRATEAPRETDALKRLRELAARPDVAQSDVDEVRQAFGWAPTAGSVREQLEAHLRRLQGAGFEAPKPRGLVSLSGAPSPQAAPVQAVPRVRATQLSDFAVEPAPFGRGAGGEVFDATHLATGIRLAVKRSPYLDESKMEGEVLDAVSADRNPHLPSFYGQFVVGDRGYVAMGKGGPPFGQTVVNTRRAVEAMLDVLDGLKSAHEHGYVHRDIKPDNVLTRPGSDGAMLIDFSNARRIDRPGASSAPAHGGAAGFIPPEQLEGRDGHALSSDLFSLAATGVAWMTGEAPFSPDKPQMQRQDWIDVYHRGPRLDGVVDPQLSAVLAKALSMDPAQRFQNAAEFEAALRPLLDRPDVSPSDVVKQFSDGTLVKEASSNRIFIMAGGAPFAVTAADYLQKVGAAHRTVRIVPDGTLSVVPATPRDGSILRELGHWEAYRMDGGLRRHMWWQLTPDEMSRLRDVPEGTLSPLPEGTRAER